MCFTSLDCDTAAATHCIDLLNESFLNATMLYKVISYRTAVSTYLAWNATTATLLLCLLMEIPTKRRFWNRRWICTLCSRKLLVNLWYHWCLTILEKHGENLKWKGTALILIYICNNHEDSSSYMCIFGIVRQSLNQGKCEPSQDFFGKKTDTAQPKNIWTMWNEQYW